ncbi:hypothetical protein ACFZAM_31610 [Streptomyces sp. NPDC008079]|uniref:hypothetical protein n=1 Tax=Streptomyces sp. NPDC008079 TaxID=3364806 RepID=UPI0036E7BA55
MTGEEDAPVVALTGALGRLGLTVSTAERFETGDVRVWFPPEECRGVVGILGLPPLRPLLLAVQEIGVRPHGGSAIGGAATLYLSDEEALRLAAVLKRAAVSDGAAGAGALS